MAPKGVVIQIIGDGASAARALELVDTHLKQTATNAKESSSAIVGSMRDVQESITLIRDAFVLDRAFNILKEMVTSSVDLGVELGHLAQQTGISASNLSVLKYASQETGIEFDTLTKGFKKLSTTIFEWEHGSKTASYAFKDLGISAKELSADSNDMWKTLGLVADRFKTLPAGIEKNAIATQLFGRAGQQLIPILNQGAAGLEQYRQGAEKLGVILTDQDVAAMEQLNASFEQMSAQISVGKVHLTEELAPALEGIIADFTAASTNTDLWREAGKQAALTAIPLAYAMEWLGQAIRETSDEYTNLSEAVNAGGYEIEAALAPTEALRNAAAARHDASMKAFHDSAADHRAAEDEDAKFLASMKDLKAQVEGQSVTSPPPQGKHPFLGGPQIQIPGPKTKSTDNIARAAAALAEANAAAGAAAVKSADDLALAQLEADHKLMLVTDADFYDEKQALEQQSIDAEISAARQKVATLTALHTKQRGDKTAKRDKDGNSAEELTTSRELVQLTQQINALQEKRAAIDVTANLGAQERADAGHLASLKAAAAMEEHVNGGIAARLAQMQAEQAEAMQKTTSEGGDVKTLAALQAQERELLQIADVERQINQAKEEGALAVKAQKDRETKDPSQRTAATKEINRLNKETAATLKDLTAQYDALAQTLGGEFIQKAAALHAEMATLNTPDTKDQQKPWKTLGDGMESMGEQMARATGKGREGFHAMVMSMEQDLVELAVKFAAERWLTPFLNGLGSGMGGGNLAGSVDPTAGSDLSTLEGFASGGDPTGPSIVGEKGPELFFPKGPGTVMPNDALQNLSKTAGGGGAPNVTMNVTNASSQPVTARQTGSTFDADSKSWMTHVILEDLSSGGPISSALRPGG